MSRSIALLIVTVTVACAPSPQQYEQEAAALCALYAPGLWGSNQNTSILGSYSQLNQKIREVIKSEAFLVIFERLSKTDYTDFYSAIQPEIRKLTGKEWQCDDARKFYAIKWEKAGSSDTQKSITYTLTKDGILQMADSNILYTDVASVKAELMKIKNKNKKVIVKVPETFKEQELDQLLVPFREAGILKLSISYY